MVEVLRSRRSPLLRALTGLVALVVALLPTTAQAVRPTLSAAATAAATFTNPIRQHVSDPYVIRYGGYYYMTSTDGCDAGYLCVWKSATISGFASAAKYDVFRIPGGQSNSAEVWAPEIHYAQGHFYIYYTATTAGVGSAHRLFVLQATGDDPTGSYTEADTGYAHGQLHESSDLWAIDPTVFTGSDGKLYIAWSGWPTSAGGQQAIYLAPMSDPLHISGDRVQISAPTRPWETVDNPDSPSSGTVGYFPVNEGPEAFQHGGRTYITFSASFCGTRSYAVGLLTNTGGTLLSSSSWTKTGPIFKYHGDVVGSASFEPITSPDGTEDWFLVHSSTAGCDAGRELRAQRLYWDARDGSPLLGYPVDDGVPLEVPSGEPGSVASADPYASGWADAFGDAAEGDSTHGRQTGAWSVTSPSAAGLTAPSGSAAWSQLFYAGNPNYEDYTVSADVRQTATGTTSAYPKYGVYASYADRDNHAEVFIDQRNGVLATHAVVQGVEQSWQNSSLPTGFDPTQYHTLKVVKAGAAYTFYLDGSQAQQRTFTGSSFPVLLNGQPGLVAEDTAADYRNVTVSNTGGGAPGVSVKYWVDTFANAPVYASPTSTTQTGTLNAGTNYVYCKVWGRQIGSGSSYNHWWLRTDPDVGPVNQYVSAYYLSRWGNDEAKDNSGTVIPDC